MKRCYSCFHEFDDAVSICPYCGQIEITDSKEPIHLLPGTILAGRYMLGLSVGAGGFGIVYKAYDMKLETVVAIKEFYVSRLVTRAPGLKNLIVSKKAQTEYEYRKKRFLAEARNMAKFGAHNSIPNVFEYFEENNTAYIVMELMNGVALNKYLSECDGKIDVDFSLLIANEVGKALASMHEKNIIHKDVAPDNIFICSGKEIRIKLMDLGAAKLCDETDNVVDIVLKPGYSPVEQYDNGNSIGPWTDIYALGATLYVMLTGVKPDESTNRKIKDEVLPPNQLNSMVSENLSNAIMKAMAVEKHMRFKNISEFLEAINGERKVVSLAKERKKKGLLRGIGIVAACLSLFVGALFGYQMFHREKEDALLKPADITVWFSVEDGSTEEDAMKAIQADFEQTYPNVKLSLRAIPADQYIKELESAAQSGELPTIFESTDVPDAVLERAEKLDDVIRSPQFKGSLFLNQYESFYSNCKKMPLAIEVPVAYVVTNGAVYIPYSEKYFISLDDFGENTSISFDDRHAALLSSFYVRGMCDRAAFLNNEANTSPVLLSSTMVLNEVRTTLTNYEKICVYPNADQIPCRFTYEWSIGEGSENELDAAERLLSWMLGNVYQSILMISKCSDGQIPVNPICFDSKIQARNLQPLQMIREKFVFNGKD